MIEHTQSMEQALSEALFSHHEEAVRHSTYDEEMLQYEEMQRGDPHAVDLGRQMFEQTIPGQLSSDLLTSWKYMFVASTTLCCRFAMDGGMESETSYNLSDLFIQKLDSCHTVQEVLDLHNAMFEEYTSRMAEIHHSEVHSRTVLRAMDYVDQHLHFSFSLDKVAAYCGITPAYLSALFKKETGMTLSEYTRRRRVDAAEVLLQYYDYSVSEIGEYLAFSSPSHFIRVFRKETGRTPKQYRDEKFRHHWKEKEQ